MSLTLFSIKGVNTLGVDLKGRELGCGISQRKDGRYQARYTDRFGKRKTIYSYDLDEVMQKYHDADYENRNHINVADSNMTLDEWYQKWMVVYKIPYIRQNTKRHYASVYTKHISPALGSFRISKITKVQVQRLLNDLRDSGYQWETQNKVRMLLNDMFTYAMSDEFMNRNPCKGVRCPTRKPDSNIRSLTRDEQALFFECCAGRWYDNLFNVAINTGLRPGELFALTWDDIDLNVMVIHVRHTLVYQKFDGDKKKEYHLEDTKTSISRRDVPINNECLKYLKRQYTQKNILSRRIVSTSVFGDRLFVTRRNNPINAMDYSSAIKEIVKDVNEIVDSLEQIEPFSGHVFRHTFATRCIEAGIRPKTVQQYLGHANIQTTMNFYVSVDREAMAEQMKLFEKSNEEITSDRRTDVSFRREMKVINF